MQYVGQTNRTLKRRISEHLSDVSNHRRTPVGLHFRTCGIDGFSFFAIEGVPNNSKRLQREAKWIARIHSLHPRGMNFMEQSFPPPPVLVLPHSNCGDRVASLAKATFTDVTCTKRRSANLLSGCALPDSYVCH
jgi:hypothetical protein